MRKLFQSEWHQIRFEDLVEVSPRALPSDEFYDTFYNAFFEKYKSYSELDPDWLKLKESIGDYCIERHFPSPTGSILSLGCGIGIIEKRLIEKGYDNVFVTENSSVPLRWIKTKLPASHIFISSLLEQVPLNKYDHLLMGSIDYFLNDAQLLALLNSSKSYLKSSGSLVMLSWSFEESLSAAQTEPENQQFWGWIRKIEEYRILFEKAGLLNFNPQVVDTETPWKTLVISV